MPTVKPIPEGRHTLTANLTVAGCARAMELYKQALGAEEVMRMPSPDGKGIWHAELRIGDSIVYLNDEMPGMGATAPTTASPAPVSFWIWTRDCDAAYQRAVAAGCTGAMPPADMFWGDRTAMVADPFGYRWNFATRVKEMTEDEMRKAGEAFAKAMAQKQG